MIQMSKKINFKDLRILEGLAIYGPRNISKVARKLKMPGETLRKRLKRLSSKFFLRLHTNIYHTNLGLKKAVVFAEAVPGYEDLLFDCLKQNDFWIHASRCYGSFEGCVGVFTIPKDYCYEFEQFLKEMNSLAWQEKSKFSGPLVSTPFLQDLTGSTHNPKHGSFNGTNGSTRSKTNKHNCPPH